MNRIKVIVLVLLLSLGNAAVRSQVREIDSLKSLLKSSKEDTVRVNILYQLCREIRKANPDQASSYCQQALTLAHKLKFTQGQIKACNTLGYIYKNTGNYPKALEYFFKGLKISESGNDESAEANSLNNIGLVYLEQGNYELAKEYFINVLNIAKSIGSEDFIAMAMSNLGSIYKAENKPDQALNFYKHVLIIRQEQKDAAEISGIMNNIGIIYSESSQYNLALEFLRKSLELSTLTNNQIAKAEIYVNIGNVYEKQGNYKESINYRTKAVEIARKINYTYILKAAYEGLITSYNAIGNKKANEYFELYANLTDSLCTSEGARHIAEMETKYDTEKKSKEIELLNKSRQVQQLVLDKKVDELKRQKILTYFGVSGIVFVMLLSFFVFKAYKTKKKANALLSRQNEEIYKQKSVIEEKNKDITDSIRYAQRIQEAVFPPEKEVQHSLRDYFIYYKPKDIVSGDFYWVEQKNDKVLFAAVDCTGHGVPGAFMSIVGYTGLNRAIKEFDLIHPADVLDSLTTSVNEILRQTYEQSKVRDGMDISLCLLDRERMMLEYAGAMNSIYLVRNNELLEFKGNRQPVGSFLEEKQSPFTNVEIPLIKNDCIYLFSDGYADQFGGPKGKKYKYSELKKTILGISNKSMNDQKLILNETFMNWKGTLEQVDDILVIGVRV